MSDRCMAALIIIIFSIFSWFYLEKLDRIEEELTVCIQEASDDKAKKLECTNRYKTERGAWQTDRYGRRHR